MDRRLFVGHGLVFIGGTGRVPPGIRYRRIIRRGRGNNGLAMGRGDITVRTASYVAEGDAIRRIRDLVFVEEQQVPVEIEHDEDDAVATHVLAFDGSAAIGTGRITADGKIGRMAVLASHRGRGVGGAILEALIAIAEDEGMDTVWCNAQCHALAFYEGFGFVAEGPVFLEAGIEHRRMTRT